MDQQESLSAETAEPYRRIALSTVLNPSCPYGTVARRKLLLNKWHLTAYLEFAKWHLNDFNCMWSKHSLAF